MAILDICAAPELAIGIIVGSLPTMPKFFQYVSVKLSKALSFAPKFSAKLGQAPEEGANNAPKDSDLTSIKLFAAKYNAGSVVDESWSELQYSRPEPHGVSLMLTDSNASSLQATHSQPPLLSGGTATRQDDLERGPHIS